MAESWGVGVGVAIVLGAWLGWPALLIVACGVLILQALRVHWNLLFIVIMVAFAMLGALRSSTSDPPPIPTGLVDSRGGIVTVESLPRTSPGGESVIVSIRSIDVQGVARETGPVRVWLWLPDGQTATPGDRLNVTWSIDTLDRIDPGYARYLASHRVVAVASAWNVDEIAPGNRFYKALVDARKRIGIGLQEVIPGDAGALAAGIVTGDDSALTAETRDAFLRTGTSHITAVSGSNVAMILAIWNVLLPAGRKRRLLAVQLLIPVSIWLYAVLVGLEPPAVRAAIMATVLMFGGRFGRRPDMLTVLALTSAGMILWHPEHVRMASFWLSVTATAAIVMAAPRENASDWAGTAKGIFGGIVVAQIATLPIVVSTFGTWSLISVIANAVLAPLMWLAFPMCFVLAGVVLLLPAIAPVLAIVPAIPLEVAIQTVRHLGTLMGPLEFHGSGKAGTLAVAIPCAIVFAMMTADSRRWGRLIEKRWSEEPIRVAIAVIGPVLGVATATAMVLFRA